jgi:hypothetical protein
LPIDADKPTLIFEGSVRIKPLTRMAFRQSGRRVQFLIPSALGLRLVRQTGACERAMQKGDLSFS